MYITINLHRQLYVVNVSEPRTAVKEEPIADGDH